MLTSKLYVLLNILAPWMLTSVYETHNNKNNDNDKRVIGIAQLSLSAVLKINSFA